MATRSGYAGAGAATLVLGLALSCSSDEQTTVPGSAGASGSSVAAGASGHAAVGGVGGSVNGGTAALAGASPASEGGNGGASAPPGGMGGEAVDVGSGGTGEGGDGGVGAVAGAAGAGGFAGAANGGDTSSGGENANPCSGSAELVWAKPVAKLGLGAYVYARSISALSDSSSVVVGELAGSGAVRFGADTPQEVAVNADGAFWARFDAAGALMAARRSVGPYANGVAVATLPGNSFVFAGYFRDKLTLDAGLPSERKLATDDPQDQDPFLARIGSDGNVAWAIRGSGPDSTLVTSVAVLPNGNVALVGTGSVTFDDGDHAVSAGFGTGLYDGYLALFSADGAPLWARSVRVNAVNHLTALDDGSIALTGWFFDSATFATAPSDPDFTISDGNKYFESMFVARYLGDGKLAWVKRTTNRGVGFSVLSGDAGRILVTGYAAGAVFSPNEANSATLASNAMFVAQYDTAGKLLEVRSSNSLYESEADVVRTPNGALVSTGAAFNGSTFGGKIAASPGGVDAFTLCQSAAGAFGWVSITGGTQSDRGRSLALLPNGDIVATGQYPTAATAAFDTSQATPLPVDLGQMGSYVLRYQP